MTNLYCENPVILVNHRLGYFLSIWKRYVTPNGVFLINNDESSYYRYQFPAYRYTPKKFNVNMSNIDQFNVISPDGEIYPMFIAVPCSKCLLCRDKKKREWSFRATCENVYSTSTPLFVTLTYNNAHKPKKGVFKEEIQLFLKRLRIKLDRKKISHNIRYFAVGEYGSKSGRPHYHLILWNFPTEKFYCITSVLHFIENCWSTPVIKNGEIQYKKNGSPETESLGFCLCVPCDRGAISYVMKYMRKEAVIPKNCLPVFFLSSRKNGGLGSQYARDMKSFYLEHPECLTMTVTDPYSGVELTQTMPSYFKRYYYPSNSTVINKTARDTFKKFCENITLRMSIERKLMLLTGEVTTPTIYDYEKKIFKKYWFLKQPFFSKTIVLPCWSESPGKLYNKYLQCNMESTSYARYLELETYDESYIVSRETLLQKRKKSLDYFFGSKPEININDTKYSLYQAIMLAQSKEIL